MWGAKRAFRLVGQGLADVAVPQADNLALLACAFRDFSDNVSAGRTQAAYASQWGQWGGCSLSLTLQENRSRGCRRARKPSWLCAWLRLSLPVLPSRKKLSTWMNRFRPSRPSPANTSNPFGRATWAVMARPALILSGVRFDLGRMFRHHAPLGIERGRAC